MTDGPTGASLDDDDDVVVEVAGFSKTFPAQRALVDLHLGLRRGEIHALVGENGSGKSTFIKCLSGYQPPDPGARLTVGGETVSLPYGAGQAAGHGLVFVHQDFGIVPTLSVMENIALGHGYVMRGGRIRWARQAEIASAALTRLGRPDIPPDVSAGRLSASSQAVIAIARGLAQAADGARLLVLDEPTAALPDAEVTILFDAVRRLAAEGMAILFVSHRLGEVFELADRVTVLRDGRKVGTFATADLDERTLIEHIVGRELSALYPDAVPHARREVVLEVRGLTGHRVRDVTFTAHRSEVVGLAGLLGSGRSELLRLLFGAQPRVGGEVLVDGRPSRPLSPGEGIADGFALVPEDRLREGALSHMSVAENMSLSTVGRYWRGGRLRRGEEKTRIAGMMREFNIQPADPDRLMGRFSGGNQQKAILAKWIETDPRVLLLDEPVQGVDVGSKSEIYELIERLAEQRGMTVLVASSDFEDLHAVCHRVLVLRAGQVVGDLAGPENTVDRMLELAYLNQEAA
jgi:ABC-type sugar transport system ATPase subunit